jgi:hypothetical protein
MSEQTLNNRVLPQLSTSQWQTLVTPDIFGFPGVFPASAWAEHIPFAYWLAAAATPRVFVELGTHGGLSYFSFCHAFKVYGIPVRSYAVDSWQGDQQAGYYDERMYNAVQKANEPYQRFSSLLRMQFDHAAAQFEDGSIDLLHFDGLHRYEDIRHDAAVWLPKLSDRGIALFHDTAERQPSFGVYRLWEELCEQYPSFEFTHGHGLGMLAVGKQVPQKVQALLAMDNNSEPVQMVKAAYERLGRLCAIEQVYLREGTNEKLITPSAIQPITEMHLQIYWKTAGSHFTEAASVIQHILLDELPTHCRFEIVIPPDTERIRIDTGFTPGVCYIHYLSIQDENGKSLYSWPADLKDSQSRDLLLLCSRLYEERILLVNTGHDPIVEWAIPPHHPLRLSVHVCLSGISPAEWQEETSRMNAGDWFTSKSELRATPNFMNS